MNTAELKLNLIDKLVSVKDENLLNQIENLLKDIDIKISPYKLNKEQIAMVQESLTDYDSNKLYTNEAVFNEDSEWLKNL